jgi:hypothetical protein
MWIGWDWVGLNLKQVKILHIFSQSHLIHMDRNNRKSPYMDHEVVDVRGYEGSFGDKGITEGLEALNPLQSLRDT